MGGNTPVIYFLNPDIYKQICTQTQILDNIFLFKKSSNKRYITKACMAKQAYICFLCTDDALQKFYYSIVTKYKNAFIWRLAHESFKDNFTILLLVTYDASSCDDISYFWIVMTWMQYHLFVDMFKRQIEKKSKFYHE